MTGRNRLRPLLGILPLLALTACAGSQRFGGYPPPGPPRAQSGPVYAAPVQPAPPIESAPVTAQPLPPPGGAYPTASAVPPAPDTGALPPPADPFFEPGAPAAATAPAAPQQPSTLGGGGGEVATLGGAARRPGVSSRDGVVGGWTAREATGSSCRVQLSSSPSLDVYRASASGCSNRDLQSVNAWDYRDGEVYLYQQGGAVVARMRASDRGSMNGAITKSGAALSMSR
jgi:hypothetical protein